MTLISIKASCPTCGEVELSGADIRLRVSDSSPEKSYYAFDCATCTNEVRKPADEHTVALLISGGIQPTSIDEPAMITVSCSDHGQMQVSADEVIAIEVISYEGELLESSSYSFWCSQGEHVEHKQADKSSLRLLRSADVNVSTIRYEQSTISLVIEAMVINGRIVSRALRAGLDFFAPRRIKPVRM